MISVLMGADNTAPSTTVTNYNFVTASNTSTWNTSETARDGVFSRASDISNLYVEVSTAPGVGRSYTFTILKNGSATALTATIAGTDTSATDSTHTASFAAGDTVTMECLPTNTPASTAFQYWNMEASGTGQPVITSYSSALSNSGTRFQVPYGSGASNVLITSSEAAIIVPASGTISRFYVLLSVAPGAGTSYAFNFMRNGVAQSLAVTVADAATTGSNTANSFSVAEGDNISLRTVPTGTPSTPAAAFGWTFTPTVNGESFIAYCSRGNNFPSQTDINYNQIIGPGMNAFDTTEADVYAVVGSKTLKNLYATNASSPGAGNSYTWTIRKNAADTALTVTNLNTTTGNISADVSFAQGDKIAIEVTPDSTPNISSTNRISCKIYVDPGPSGGAATTTNALLLHGVG